MDEKARKSVLGRGLNSLIPVTEYDREFVRKIKVTDIISNRFQPRNNFEEEKLKELEDSIKEHGIIQPVIVRKIDSGYELIAGERRFLAVKRLGLEEIPALVKNVSDQKSLELALIENIQRDDLNPIEEAKGYQTLCREFKLSHDTVAQKVGRSRASVTNTMRLLKLPSPVQQGLIDGALSVGHAKVILGLSDEDLQLKLFEKIQKKGLNVRETEKVVQALVEQKKQPVQEKNTDLPYKYNEYARMLHTELKTGIEIRCSGTAGKVIIHFSSEEELDRIVEQIQQKSSVTA